MEEVEKLMKQAHQALADGDYPKALSRFEKVTKVDPPIRRMVWKGGSGRAVPKVKTEDILEAYKKAAELIPRTRCITAP